MQTSVRVAAHIFTVRGQLQKMSRRITEIQVAIQGGHWSTGGSILDHGYFIGADIYSRKDTCINSVMSKEEAKG